MTKIQYVSDLHLEFEDPNLAHFQLYIKPEGDILVLAGNIGNPFYNSYRNLLRWCKRRFQYTILVAGNHEYYNSSIRETNEKLKQLSRECEVFFLNNESVIIPEYRLLFHGSTLWSEIEISDIVDVVSSVADYKLIQNFGIEVSNRLHRRAKRMLFKALTTNSEFVGYKHIVITHHAPLLEGTVDPKYDSCRSAFASDCADLVDLADIWIFGHTHYCTDFEQRRLDFIDPTIILSNQRGYKNECTEFNPSKYITIY